VSEPSEVGPDLGQATHVATIIVKGGAEPNARPVAYGFFEESPLAQDEYFSS
jgi:hypothetical protein